MFIEFNNTIIKNLPCAEMFGQKILSEPRPKPFIYLFVIFVVRIEPSIIFANPTETEAKTSVH